jgi:hypothetical protein
VTIPSSPADQTGVYLVTTLSGTRYLLNFSAMTATRYLDLDDDNTLRRDDEERPLLFCTYPTIGEPLTLVLDLRGDGVPTVRSTNLVSAVERIA